MDPLKNLDLTPSSSPWFPDQYGSCDIHLATGCGPWEVPGPIYRMSEVLKSRGIPHHLDDWSPERRTRMALLASPKVGIRRRALLTTPSSWPASGRSLTTARNRSPISLAVTPDPGEQCLEPCKKPSTVLYVIHVWR